MQPWRHARTGLQMVFFAWLVNACAGFLHGFVFNAMIEAARHGGSPATWKLLDRLSTVASFTDLAAMVVAALGMFLCARTPPQAGAAGLATGGFACLLGSIAVSFYGFVEQLLMATKAIRDPLVAWESARYIYLLEALTFIVAVILFVTATMKIAQAVGASQATWQGIVAVIAIPLATILVTLPMWVPSLAKLRFDHRWLWFLLSRGIRATGDLMLLLFLAHLGRLLARPAPAAAPPVAPRR